jgi:hypothetical protein
MLAICLLCSSCFKSLPGKQVIYQNDFETDDTSHIQVSNIFGIVDSLKVVSYNGSKVLGRFNSHLVLLKLDTLPQHNALTIEFDLYIHDKWDGDYIPPGSTIPDAWIMRVDNYPVYITTFSNGTYPQSFPDNYNGSMSKNPARSNAWGVRPGVCGNQGQADGTSYYRIEYTTTHNGGLELSLSDVLQPFNSPCLKSWSVDNIRITAIEYK